MIILKEIPYYRLCGLTEWRMVKGHPRYSVSCNGEVVSWNWKRTGKPRLCRLSKTKIGYLHVGIDCVKKYVHRLVAEAFIPNPKGKPCIDHINTTRTDNRVENLRFCTCEENSNNPLSRKHLSDNQWCRGKFGAEHHNSKQIVQLSLNGHFIKKWSCAREVYRELGINHGNIAACCKVKRSKAGGYRWMYYSDWKKQKKSVADIKPLFY